MTPPAQARSKICEQWRTGTCSYKKMHTWKECPNNKWGINAGKEVDGDGDIILCTIANLEEILDDSADATLVERVYKEEGDEILSNDNKKSVKFYFSGKVSTVNSPRASYHQRIFCPLSSHISSFL